MPTTRTRPLAAALCAMSIFAAAPAAAGPAAEALATCLADNTSGKDRKDLVRWIFTAMAAHPQMKGLSNVTPQLRDETMVTVGRLMTRLIGETCAAQTRTAVQQEGIQSVSRAFEQIGRLAMQELMTNPEVASALSGVDRYVDRKKIDAATGR